MARYGQAFKDRAVARLLPPESASLDEVARDVGISAVTLDCWLKDAQSRPARSRSWTAAARLEAVIETAAMNEAQKSAWCRQHGVFAADLDQWRSSAMNALATPEEQRASPQATRSDRTTTTGTTTTGTPTMYAQCAEMPRPRNRASATGESWLSTQPIDRNPCARSRHSTNERTISSSRPRATLGEPDPL